MIMVKPWSISAGALRSGAANIENASKIQCQEIPMIINRNLIEITIFERCIG